MTNFDRLVNGYRECVDRRTGIVDEVAMRERMKSDELSPALRVRIWRALTGSQD